MAIINPNLLISAAVLQDYLVDKDGQPLSAGVITLFSDTQRSLLQPWYMQQGTNPPYSYVPLPNPMVLSAAGTIQDVDGNDVIPYFYPYTYNPFTDSYTNVFNAYYITVYNSDGELQFTRSNFPFVANSGSTSPVDTNESLLVNNVFWRNSGITNVGTGGNSPTGTISINSINYTYWTLAPSQHDGYIMPDISYFKNSTDGTESISFPTFVSSFPDQILVGDITPECYMNINCSAPGSSTTRYVQIPLSLHIDSLSGFTEDTFTLQAMSVDNLNEVLTVGIYQFCGTGVTTPAISQQTITLGPGWNKFSLNLPIPSAQGVTVGAGGDDALYIQIGFPTNGSFNVNIAVPSFYLSNSAATNSFQTYDEVNAIASSPRTGDTRISYNSFSPYGWTPMNDGVIALNAPTNLPISRINSDVWLVYNLMWNIAKPYDSGSNFNPICQIYTNAGVATNFGSSAYADFSANNRALALTKAMGRVLLGTVPISSLINSYKTTFTVSNSGGFLVITAANNVNFFNGMPVTFTGSGLPSTISANNVYYVTSFNGSTGFFLSTTFAQSVTDTPNVAFAAASGINNVISANTGAREGEYSHLLTLNQMFNHTHNYESPSNVASGGGGSGLGGGSGRITSGITGYGGQTPFNVTQPGTFTNIFIKL